MPILVTEDCQSCHQVEVDEILGAFQYTLSGPGEPVSSE